jgi:RND family efflux transporter MFP subunit
MNMYRFSTSFVAIVVFAGSACAELPSQPLVVSNCRVALIRRASLAGARLGILQTVSVSEGDLVERGQVVATLRDEMPRQALAIAQKEMANTVELRLNKKISELATLEYSKAMELNRTIPGGVSEIDVKKLRLAAEKSLLQLEQADFLLQMAALKTKEAEVTLDSYRIVAPFSGVVLHVAKQPGEALGAGEIVAEIANFDTMRVEGFIPVADSAWIHRGAAVMVEVSGAEPQRTTRFEGRLKHIAPVVNEVSQEVRVWAEIDNRRNLLKDGLPATMRISLSRMPIGDLKAAAE